MKCKSMVWNFSMADQGGVKGHGAHLLPQIHQKHIYMWNSFHRIPIESLQKSSYKQGCKIPT